MAYGNNRKGEQPRAHFQLAGGSIIKFKHPYLAGQLSSSYANLDEIDVSSCVKLEGRFFEAEPNQDSAKQVVLIDGSTVTICNKLLNGTITMPVVRTTGIVATGDFISALQLIKSIGDGVGGMLFKTDYINGKAITKLYYGVTPKRVPDDVAEGNDVSVYNIQLFYAGWIEAVSNSSSMNIKKIWAVGSSNGIEGFFTPYKGQNIDGESGTGTDMLSATNLGISNSDINDSNTADTTSEASAMEATKSYDDTGTAVDAGFIATVQSVVKPATTSGS